MNSSEQERLQGEIEELRGKLGETVEALVHKADVPSRVKERGAELRDQAVERGTELRDQAVERGTELRDQAVERGTELRDQALKRGAELRDQALKRGAEVRDQVVGATEWAREAASRTPATRWGTLASIGAAAITLIIILRRIRTR